MTDTNQVSHEQLGLLSSTADGSSKKPQGSARSPRVGPEAPLTDAVRKSSTPSAKIRSSMLWAAYGDALGFISELVDHKGLDRRTGGVPLDQLMAWKRRVGGRWGLDVLLPAGCWSDDTQLRMAVSRSIGSHGFDIESFARVELPVWPSYALGGGRASKAAAKNLGKPSTLWYANTYTGWTNAGGNGAAMRIQPHVWAATDLNDGYMLDVITDSVCTHGHPRAIVGACFHASTLAHCLRVGTVPETATCLDIASRIKGAICPIEDHRALGTIWIGLWEQASGKQFRNEWQLAADELSSAVSRVGIRSETEEDLNVVYKGLVERLGLTAEHQRGSGILTTVAATALAAAAPSAQDAVVVAANALGTDTDTIATMAGALLGACDGTDPPPQDPLDSAYLSNEADRLSALSQGQKVAQHAYPDVLTWTSPKTQADALVSDGDHLVIEGLGRVSELDACDAHTANNDFAWQWVKTQFGQTLLIKRRQALKSLEANNDLTPPPAPVSTSRSGSTRSRSTSGSRTKARSGSRNESPQRSANVEDSLSHTRRNLSDDTVLGKALRQIARNGSLSDLLSFTKEIRDDLRR